MTVISEQSLLQMKKGREATEIGFYRIILKIWAKHKRNDEYFRENGNKKNDYFQHQNERVEISPVRNEEIGYIKSDTHWTY